MQMAEILLNVFFYAFGGVALLAGAGVVFSKNPVRAVLSLVLAFVAMAGVWMLLQSEFLSLALILVYVGAVMVLFLFVVMMLNIQQETIARWSFARYWPVAVLIGLCVIGEIVWAFMQPGDAPLFAGMVLPQQPLDYNNIQQLGLHLYTEFVYPFEIAGVILLVAIVAAIALCLQPPRARKNQWVSEQVQVEKAQRLRVVTTVTPDSPLTVEDK